MLIGATFINPYQGLKHSNKEADLQNFHQKVEVQLLLIPIRD